MKQYLVAFLCNLLHRKCNHPPEKVVLFESDGENPRSWCRTCGAIRREKHWELAVDPWSKGPTTQALS